MKVIIHLTIPDDDRTKMSQSLGHSGMVTRKQVTEAVNNFITEQVNGIQARDVPASAGQEGKNRNDLPAFTPSRGDEPYLYRPKDPELAAKCSALLDDIERFDRYIWKKLEENRQ